MSVGAGITKPWPHTQNMGDVKFLNIRDKYSILLYAQNSPITPHSD